MFFTTYVVYSLKLFKLKTEECIIYVHFHENFTIAESKIHAYFFYYFLFSWETYPGLVSQVLNDKAWLFEMWITLSTG